MNQPVSISENIIHDILQAGTLAPSGDNCQPWHFERNHDTVNLYNIAGRDTSLFNYSQRASYIAHGACLENIAIAATAHGLKAETDLFPDPNTPDHVATIRFVASLVNPDPLFSVITDRCTNRRRYNKGPLDEGQTGLLQQAKVPSTFRLQLFEGDDKKWLADIIAINDRLVFENCELHRFLFDHIRWNFSEVISTCDGMDLRTLELSSLDAVAFRLFRHFGLLRILNKLGLSRIIGANARKLAMSASALGLISGQGTGPEDYVNCGRTMERFWLQSTHLGLSFQLMTGITFLMGRVHEGDFGSLSADQVELVREGRSKLGAMLDADHQIPLIIFRVGNARMPSARSLRKSI